MGCRGIFANGGIVCLNKFMFCCGHVAPLKLKLLYCWGGRGTEVLAIGSDGGDGGDFLLTGFGLA